MAENVKITQLDAVDSLNGTDSFVVEQASAGTKRATQATLKTSIIGNTAIDGMGGTTVTGAIKALNDFLLTNSSVGFHNSFARGKSLGTSITTAQLDAIKAGTFDDMFIGDYWTINNVTFRIAAFDFYFNRQGANVHHVVIIPDDTIGTPYKMNDTATNAGGFAGSKLHSAVGDTTAGSLNDFRTSINNRIGGDGTRLYQHLITLSNVVEGGVVTGVSASVSVDLTIPTVANIFGSPVERKTAASCLLSIDDQQFPLFKFMPEKQRCQHDSSDPHRYWTRDCYGTGFVAVSTNGNAYPAAANVENVRVRPVFCIRKPAST